MMRLLPKERYGRPFGLSYRLSNRRFVLDTVIGSEPMTGPTSGIGFLFAGRSEEFNSMEELEITAAARGILKADIGNTSGYYSDMKEVQELVAATNPDAVEI